MPTRFTPHLSLFSRCLWIAILGLTACDEAGGNAEKADLGADRGVVLDSGASDGGVDAATMSDAGPLADLDMPDEDAEVAGEDAGPPCIDDKTCTERTHCDMSGRCVANLEAPIFVLPADGVTRAGAARFELSPAYLETWEDRAGPQCPDNRAGRFDGRMDEPDPEDPCRDRFDDANGDRHFDAVWLGGAGNDRPANGVDNADPPEGRVLVLGRDAALQVLITLDVYALDAARVAELQRRLRARLGLDLGAIAVHATGTRSGPDAVGIDGPTLAVAGGAAGDALVQRAAGRLALLDAVPFASGLDEAWFSAMVDRAALAVERALRRAEPVRLRAARTALGVERDLRPDDGQWRTPDANEDGRRNDAEDRAAFARRLPPLARDTHLPPRTDPWLRVLALDSTANGAPVALLAAWGAAPAALPLETPLLSADFPGVFRRAVEARQGGVALWLTAAAADTVLGGEGAFVPAVDAEGLPIDHTGRPVAELSQAAPALDPVDALGRLLARRATDAISGVRPVAAELRRTSRWIWLPITNPRLGLAADLGVLGPFADWLTGRVMARAWVSGATTPACGGLGCARYRLDLIELGPVSLLFGPGALDGGLVQGRADTWVDFADARALRDLDVDGRPDVNEEIEVQTRSGGRDIAVKVAGPANPQRFAAATGLESETRWIIGRTGGAMGSLWPAESAPNVFEGQLEPLLAFAASPSNADIDVCALGFPCAPGLGLAALAQRVVDRQPQVLADLPGGQEIRVTDADFEGTQGPYDFNIYDDDERPRLSGSDLILGPADVVWSASANFRTAGVGPGQRLRVAAVRREFFTLGELVPLVLRAHPNGAELWRAESPGGGDLLYNGLCDLLFAGACPHPRPAGSDDPNLTLPRQP